MDKSKSGRENENGECEKIPSHKKSKLRIKIRAIFQDKTTIFNNKVVDTFMEIIKKIGPENIKNLGILQNGIPIISDKKDNLYGKSQKLILPNFYVMTHSSTNDKLKQLHEINERLNLGMKIEEIMPTNDH